MKLHLNAMVKALCVLALGVGSVTLTDVAHASEHHKKTKSSQIKKEIKTSKKVEKHAKKKLHGKKALGTGKSKVSSSKKANYAPNNIKYTVFNYKNGEILEESNSNVVWPIASLTKLMTAYVFVTNTPDLKNCTTAITEEDNDLIKNTHTRLSAHKVYSCENLLQVMLVASDNYAASALARSIPGWGKADFVKKMNIQAKEWGLTNTRFVDSSGLSPENHSTPDDYRKLAMNVVKNQEISKVSSQHEITAENKWNKVIQYRSSNKLIREYGLEVALSKTGYIRESGYNLVHLGLCSNNVGVIEFGARSSDQRAYFVKQKLSKYGCI
jgi:D-alanyl-D-alanine endopeptidase (penicillin-binding protein 7)